jgi:hypothetical protein
VIKIRDSWMGYEARQGSNGLFTIWPEGALHALYQTKVVPAGLQSGIVPIGKVYLELLAPGEEKTFGPFGSMVDALTEAYDQILEREGVEYKRWSWKRFEPAKSVPRKARLRV